MKKEMLPAVILGLFSFSNKNTDSGFLPPPPPFPDMEMPEDRQTANFPSQRPNKPKMRTKITIKGPTKETEDIFPREMVSDNVGDAGEALPSFIPQEDHWSINLSEPMDTQGTHPDLSNEGNEINAAIEGIKQPSKEEKQGFLKRLFAKKEPALQETPPAQDMPLQKVQDNLSEVERVMNQINEARQMIMDINLAKAKDAYVEIMKSYRMMTDAEQMQVYEAIKELYDERKAAESLHIK